jgi:hypothetical protein
MSYRRKPVSTLLLKNIRNTYFLVTINRLEFTPAAARRIGAQVLRLARDVNAQSLFFTGSVWQLGRFFHAFVVLLAINSVTIKQKFSIMLNYEKMYIGT